jgi:hypothetical protein
MTEETSAVSEKNLFSNRFALPPRSSEHVDKIVPAMIKAGLMITPPPMEGTGPYGKHSTVQSYEATPAMVLAEHGLKFIHTTTVIDRVAYFITQLFHVSGQFFSTFDEVGVPANQHQKVLSAKTYLKRDHYSELLALAGDTDNDGAGLAPETTKKTVSRAPVKAPPRPIRDVYAAAKKAIKGAANRQQANEFIAAAALRVTEKKLTEKQYEELCDYKDELWTAETKA